MVSLNGLNDAQLKAATSMSKKILTLAGAGTGKTGTLTRRVAYLNDNRVSCNNMLCLTFTRNAGKEMKERIIKLIGKRAGSQLFCNTFHAFCVKVLRDQAHLIGYTKDFTIYDEDDTNAIIASIVTEFNLETKPKKVLEILATIKRIDIASKTAEIEDKAVETAIKEYFYRLKQNNAIDFEGLLEEVLHLFMDRPDIVLYYHQIYQHVFVDEFQDTNDLQWQIITMLDPENLFLVGDDFQSIYGWRHANINIILGLAENPDWEVIKLEINYRSTVQIVEAANNLIKYNKQTDKTLIASKEGPEIDISDLPDDDKHEASIIAGDILGDFNGKYSDFAILTRTNKQLEILSETLDRSGIPNVVVSSKNDPLKKEDIKKVLAYLNLYVNPQDNHTFRKVINFPRLRLTELQLREIQLQATRNESGLYFEYSLPDPTKSYDMSLLDIFEMFLDKHIEEMDATDAFLETVNALGLSTIYLKESRTNRMLDIENAYAQISTWVTIQKSLGEGTTLTYFLKWLRLKDMQERLTENTDTVKLMTLHAAKGLEFPVVIMVGLNDGMLPSAKGDIEEERRLAYVGITRAREKLYLSRAKFQWQPWGNFKKMTVPSQFLREIK